MIDMFIEHGFDHSTCTNESLMTPFLYLCQSNNSKVENYLCFLERGYKIKTKNGNEETPLHLVSSHIVNKTSKNYSDLCEVYSLLIVNKINIYSTNNDGETALQYSNNSALIDTVQVFLDENTLLTKERFCFYPKKFRQKVISFIVSLKIYFKKLKILFPRPLIWVIVHMSSLVVQFQSKKKRKSKKNKSKKKKKN